MIYFSCAQTISVTSQFHDSHFYVHDCLVIFWYPSQYVPTYRLQAFLVLALFVLCLTAIMSLAEGYKSLFCRTEEDKGNSPFSNQFLILTVTASVMPLVAMALTFVEGRDLACVLHFNGAFMILFLYGILPIILNRGIREYQLQDLTISSISSLPQALLGAGTLCALGQEIVQGISWLPNFMG